MSGLHTLLTESERYSAKDALQKGLPSKQVESWKYLPSRTLNRTNWVSASHRESTGFALNGGRFANLPLCDGMSTSTHSSLNPSEIARLENIASAHGFSLAQDALNTDCLLLEVMKLAEVRIDLSRLANNASEAGFATLVIRVGEGARLLLIEQFEDVPRSQPNLDSLRILADVSRNGEMKHLRFQTANDHAQVFTEIAVDISENGHYNLHTIDFGAKLSRTDIEIRLSAEQASTKINGLAVTNGSQYHDTHLAVEHRVGDTQSAMTFRNMVDGKGEATFNGRVLIEKNAQRSATEQSVGNLLLSKTARVNPKPELEIYADDVTASHGCTVGSLNQNELFYLKSRGISETDARAFLQYAFAAKLVELIEDAEIRELVESRLLGELKHGELISELKESVHV
jgi:Fe-S cluster assembly protein SufD